MTGYNWENNASHAGTDWENSNDDYMTWIMDIPDSKKNEPGIVITSFHDGSIKKGSYSLITLQMAGYAARDKNGMVTEDETAPSKRWVECIADKGEQLSLKPDTSNNFVFMNEEVNFLIKVGSKNSIFDCHSRKILK